MVNELLDDSDFVDKKKITLFKDVDEYIQVK